MSDRAEVIKAVINRAVDLTVEELGSWESNLTNENKETRMKIIAVTAASHTLTEWFKEEMESAWNTTSQS